MKFYTPDQITEAQAVVQAAKNNWPFKQLSAPEIAKLEFANRVLKNEEVFSEESPY